MANNVDANVLRCAKQVYTNLQLKERVKLLSNSDMPLEVKKMERLLNLTDKTSLDVFVKKFLNWNHESRKKNLSDFIQQLDKEVEIYLCEQLGDDNEFDNDSDFGGDLDESLLLELTEPTKKRVLSPSPYMEQEGERGISKKLKISTSKATPVLTNNCFASGSFKSDLVNVICSPSSNVKIFTDVPWITLYEISRFVLCCKIPWNEIPFDAFRKFLHTAQSNPRNLYDTMIKWNQETRLGLRLNGLAYTSMDRCPENVYTYMQRLEKENINTVTAKQVIAMSPVSPSPTSSSEAIKRESKLKNRTIHYSGILQFKTTDSPPHIILRAPKIDASNRLFRKFGHDRFLELKLSKSSKPSLIRYHSNFFLKPFLLMQRTYSFLFVKDDIVILFATEGVDLKPITVQQIINWHMPILENWSMSISKYASRMSLGYSSSIPTLQFKPHEIRYVDDIYAQGTSTDETLCMTDGCGIISASAMKIVMGCQATDELPCAIQGRIAGAKGIWIISPDLDFTTGNYIEIRKSQDKFKTGLPQDDASLDPLHYTFDLVKNSVCVYPSNLNTQFIQTLSSNGVPTQVFIEILKEYIHRLAEIVTENQNVKVLRDWVAKCGNVMNGRWEEEDCAEKGLWNDIASSEDEVDSGFFSMAPNNESGADEQYGQNIIEGRISSDFLVMRADSENRRSTYNKINKHSGFPAGLHESIIRLLDAGFDLSNAYVATRVTVVFRKVMQSITTKYKIEVPQSCTVTCVPDPTHTLEPGEVFLQLSSRRKDEKTGIRAGQILGDVIVTRNPCGLKSDIQKVKAVDCTVLRMYTDVIIFSVKGDVSLASQLSGGDYDGDIIFCCWDERIVKPFNSYPVQKQSERVQKAFEKDSTTVGQEIGASNNVEKAIQKSFVSVNLPDSTLGQYENWRTVLAEQKSLEDPSVVYLAHMCAKLVDAPKQGLRLCAVSKKNDLNEFAKLAYPAWFMDKKNKQREGSVRSYKETNSVYTMHDAPCVTTMDFLFDTLLKETAAFTRYSRSLFCDEDVPYKDTDLTTPWTTAYEYATKYKKTDLLHDLDLIAHTIKENRDTYSKQCGEFQSQRTHYMDNIQNPARYSENKFVDELQSRFNNYLELEEYFAKDYNESPTADKFKSEIIIFDILNGGKQTQRLKASYAYLISITNDKYSKYCYIVGYDVLRRIKADACASLVKGNGLAETVSVSTYKAMNLDRKYLKRLKENAFIESGVEKVRLLPDLNGKQ
ncbi:RNA dependent RNA polymerase-domain-containing protein [Thamnidium elegans]|uniref:RNA-dependent RNA polymerase n=1 Tax=Thamnidium elegans TaxID=101142 RepID=A0A8H7SQU4_9FUNG|nr:hypothetical protein INT48_007396 [Thamnidium elegans]KAI8072122.1 RNA dependent RNA polymerase-domain-containing protein [Thamnidium elegans]